MQIISDIEQYAVVKYTKNRVVAGEPLPIKFIEAHTSEGKAYQACEVLNNHAELVKTKDTETKVIHTTAKGSVIKATPLYFVCTVQWLLSQMIMLYPET